MGLLGCCPCISKEAVAIFSLVSLVATTYLLSSSYQAEYSYMLSAAYERRALDRENNAMLYNRICNDPAYIVAKGIGTNCSTWLRGYKDITDGDLMAESRIEVMREWKRWNMEAIHLVVNIVYAVSTMFVVIFTLVLCTRRKTETRLANILPRKTGGGVGFTISVDKDD